MKVQPGLVQIKLCFLVDIWQIGSSSCVCVVALFTDTPDCSEHLACSDEFWLTWIFFCDELN